MSDRYKDFKKSLFKEKYIRDRQEEKKKKDKKDLGSAISEGGLFGRRKK